jgi:hypothetical protein
MDNELWAKLYEQKHADINGYGVWLYLISSSIENFYIVQWEAVGHDLREKIFRYNPDGAEKLFAKKCSDLIKGKFDK